MGTTVLATHLMTYVTSTNFNRSGSSLLACNEIATAEELGSSKSKRISEEIPLESGILPYNFEPNDTDSSLFNFIQLRFWRRK